MGWVQLLATASLAYASVLDTEAMFLSKMVVRVHSHPKSPRTVDSVVIALEKNAQLSEDHGLDVWAAGPGYMDIMVSQDEASKMEAAGHMVMPLIDS